MPVPSSAQDASRGMRWRGRQHASIARFTPLDQLTHVQALLAWTPSPPQTILLSCHHCRRDLSQNLFRPRARNLKHTVLVAPLGPCAPTSWRPFKIKLKHCVIGSLGSDPFSRGRRPRFRKAHNMFLCPNHARLPPGGSFATILNRRFWTFQANPLRKSAFQRGFAVCLDPFLGGGLHNACGVRILWPFQW